jgi:SPP1 gp7 family putative phage head morphogenesis protein
MADQGHKLTDERLADLEKRLHDEYEQAAKDIQKKLDKYMKKFATKDAIWKKSVEAGIRTQEEYDKWRVQAIAAGERWEKMKARIVADQLHTNQIAREIIDREMPGIFELNANFALYQVEHDAQIDTSLTLYNRQAVDRILRDDPEMLLPPGRRVSQQIQEGKAERWERNKVQSVMTQGILQGESIPKLASRLASAVADSYYKAAVRNARTMATNAQNAGRYDAYNRLESNGVELTLEWAATLDNRTRHEHRMMHGQRRNVGEPFEVSGVKIMYPAQTGSFMSIENAPQELIWNCRCTILAYVKGYEHDTITHSDKMGKMTFEEWLEAKPKPQNILHQKNLGDKIEEDYIKEYRKMNKEADEILKNRSTVVNGQDISTTWKRRKDQFDFEIDDVLNAQGFDGKPRVVSKAEFDEAVKNANFIAQRAYSAPDQETLDAYRQQLYDGKWYVDCSTGGARHGQGMYCIADYSGNITGDMRSEASAYAGYYGNRPSYIETFTVDPSAKFIEEATIREKMNAYNEGLRSNAYRDAISETTRPESVTSMIDKYKKYFGVTMTPDDMAAYMKGMQLKNMESDDFTSSVKKQTNQIIKKYKLKDHSLVQSAYRNTDAYKNASSKEFSDIGSFAAAAGWDGIKVSGREGQAPYAVILNRTKVIFLKED